MNQFQYLHNRCWLLQHEFDLALTNIYHQLDNIQIQFYPLQSHPFPIIQSNHSFILKIIFKQTLYLSTIGIRRGPSILRLNDGKLSKSSINTGPLNNYHNYYNISIQN